MFEKIMIYFGFFMVALYAGLGILFLFFPVFTYLPPNIKGVFGAFFLLYGIFRLVRLIQKVKES
jgi:uncharacterized membrane protein HdeD (DUF308 family)